MKKLAAFLFLFIAFATTSVAQVPEFWFEVGLKYQNSSWIARPVYFGYDAAAFDSIEGAGNWVMPPGTGEFGELQYPPDDGAFGPGFFLRGLTFLEGQGFPLSKVDIRRKPVGDSFVLEYRFIVFSNGVNGATLSWDPARFPSKVRHVTLAPSIDKRNIKLDMTKAASLDLMGRDSLDVYREMVLTLFYNREIGDYFSGTSGVEEVGAIDGISVYPNPYTSDARVRLELKSRSRVTLQLLDEKGGLAASDRFLAEAGTSERSIASLVQQLPAGSYFLRVLSSSAFGEQHRTLRIVKND